MNTYITMLGYEVRETISGLDVVDDGDFVCEINGKSLNDYREDPSDELSDINDDRLEADIKEIVEAEEFINYQKEYC
jgi:glutathione synthase/RimK-type ligase-like ATP-grasp enzyme